MHHQVNIMNLETYVDQLPRGGKKVLALQLGVTASYLSRLVSGDRAVTAERALQIEKVTEGRVTRYDLRPDLQWGQPRRVKNSNATKLPPTLNRTIRTISSTVQSANAAVNPYSRNGSTLDGSEVVTP